jgi:hypothetical protein
MPRKLFHDRLPASRAVPCARDPPVRPGVSSGLQGLLTPCQARPSPHEAGQPVTAKHVSRLSGAAPAPSIPPGSPGARPSRSRARPYPRSHGAPLRPCRRPRPPPFRKVLQQSFRPRLHEGVRPPPVEVALRAGLHDDRGAPRPPRRFRTALALRDSRGQGHVCGPGLERPGSVPGAHACLACRPCPAVTGVLGPRQTPPRRGPCHGLTVDPGPGRTGGRTWTQREMARVGHGTREPWHGPDMDMAHGSHARGWP